MLGWLQQARIGKKRTLVLGYSEKPLPFNIKCSTHLHWRLWCTRVQRWMRESFLEEMVPELYLRGWMRQGKSRGHSRWQGHQEQKHGGENEWGVQQCHKHSDFATVCSESKQEIEIGVWQSFLSYAGFTICSITVVIWETLMKAAFWLSMLMGLQTQNSG